jgi:hypothetical protein
MLTIISFLYKYCLPDVSRDAGVVSLKWYFFGDIVLTILFRMSAG